MGLFKKRSPDKYEGENLIEEIYGRQTEREISEIESRAERVEAYEKVRSRKKRRTFLRAAGIVLLLGVLTLFVVYIGYKLLFVVSDITVMGESPYSEEEICAAAGVNIGDSLYSFSSKKAEEKLMAALPYIGSLEVEREAPDKVTLTVKCESAVYYTDIYGKTYLMSETLRLLEEVGEGDVTGLVWLQIPGVRSAELGSVPVLRDENMQRLMTETTAAVRESELSDRVGRIDVRDMFSLTMVCDGKYLLEFGDYTEVPSKLRVAEAVLRDEMFNNDNKARLDLSKLSETSVIVDSSIDLTK